MAWDYPEGYPQNRNEAVALMMTIKEEDIDLSDIPEISIPEGTVIQRAGDRFRKVGQRNIKRLNEIFNEYHEMKQTLAKLQQEHPELFKETDTPCTYSAQ